MNELRPKLFDVMKGYTREQLIKDIISGIIVAIIALPLSIALAIASGVGEENTCEKIHDCATILVWQKMNEAINDVVDHMTLQDLVDYEMKECSDYVI